MDTIETYRQIIEKILGEYSQFDYAYGDIEKMVIFDRQNDHYLLLAIGWEGAKRVHGCIIHIDILDGKVWIQRDGLEHGVAQDLIEAGIPKAHIVLGFHSTEIREHTGYAIA